MNRRLIGRRSGIGLAAAALVPLPAAAQQPRVERVVVVEAGRFEARVTGQAPAQDSPTGRNEKVSDIRLVDPSLRIPGKIGVLFGIRFQVSGSPVNERVGLREVWRLPMPGARNPATGRIFLESSFDFRASIGQIHFRGYGFDHDWEIVPGEWMIEIWEGVRKMAMHRFTVYRA